MRKPSKADYAPVPGSGPAGPEPTLDTDYVLKI